MTKAATLAARLGERALGRDLAAALVGLIDRADRKADPGCSAKLALARALTALEHDDPEPFRRGVAYVQMEPVWGDPPQVDSAGELRGCCLSGLVAMGDRDALFAAVPLLVDPRPEARVAAARAVAATGVESAELLLRLKALAGDAEPQVVADCLAGCLRLSAERAVGFVAPFLAHADDVVAEAAALALGETRLPQALDLLQRAFHETLDPRRRARLLLPAALLRSDEALAWLLEVLAESEREHLAAGAARALRLFAGDPAARARIEAAIARRGDAEVTAAFAGDAPGAGEDPTAGDPDV